jgi:putative ABC transport system permease protein
MGYQSLVNLVAERGHCSIALLGRESAAPSLKVPPRARVLATASHADDHVLALNGALGATRKHIVLQFLVETGALSTLGGVIGILLGVGISLGLHPLIEAIVRLPMLVGAFDGRLTLEPRITTWSIVVSFVVAAGVGLVFGIYPAIIASRKDPIEALRHD